MKVLITNDDGYAAPGLRALAAAIVAAGHDVWVAAPRREQSGASASIGRVEYGSPVSVQEHTLTDLPGVPVYSVDAPPGLAVKLALSGWLAGVPDVVVSGINGGWNTGRSAIHSGTLGAALTACVTGARAMAVSCQRGSVISRESAARVAVEMLDELAAFPEPVAMNVNVPEGAFDKVRGTRVVPVDRVGLYEVGVSPRDGSLRYELVVNDGGFTAGHDSAVVLEGYVSVTMLTGRYEECRPM
jgi:5'-nucleotidase